MRRCSNHRSTDPKTLGLVDVKAEVVLLVLGLESRVLGMGFLPNMAAILQSHLR